MKTVEFNDMLRTNRIYLFTLADAMRLIGKPKQYTSLFLSRNKKIRMATRGLYYTEDATEYEVASAILNPSYISLISALRFHNLTEQIPHVIYVVSYKRHRPLPDLNGYGVEFVTINKRMFYGYEKIDGATVATPEKAVVDMLYLNRFAEYAYEAIEEGRVDSKKLLYYAVMSNDKRLIRAVKVKLSGYKEVGE